MCGEPAAFDQLVPLVVFGDPEVAAVGLSERSASAAGQRVVVGKATFGVNGRALTIDQPDGFVKLVADAEHGVVLGAQIVGPEASELISELTVAVECAPSARRRGRRDPSAPDARRSDRRGGAAGAATRRVDTFRLTDKRSFVSLRTLTLGRFT